MRPIRHLGCVLAMLALVGPPAAAVTTSGDGPGLGSYHTWGYIGCSNTHDAMYGYQYTPGALGRFWPWARPDGVPYSIEGGTVHRWLTDPAFFWQLQNMVRVYDEGANPPVIFIQPCAQINPSQPNYWPLDQNELNSLIDDVRHRFPTSILYVGPLQDYDPIDLCRWMGRGGIEIATYKDWLSQEVGGGLALAGPAVNGVADLGPLAENGTVWTDGCHPTGDPHHPAPFDGSGVQLLGGQLSQFFDRLPG